MPSESTSIYNSQRGPNKRFSCRRLRSTLCLRLSTSAKMRLGRRWLICADPCGYVRVVWRRKCIDINFFPAECSTGRLHCTPPGDLLLFAQVLPCRKFCDFKFCEIHDCGMDHAE